MLAGSSGNLEIYGAIAHGGMATIRYARLTNPAGALDVVIKRPHEHFAKDPEFVKMLMDEAQLSLRIQHANVVRTLGVIEQPALALVLEYVHGEALSELLESARAAHAPVSVPIATALISGVLHGLHAAHETRGDDGLPLQIVHRDVSPENILVGVDGVPRLLDFGIAKAVGRIRSTPSGELKGKLAYLAPEQLSGGEITRCTDIYGAAVVLWEILAGKSLFLEAHESATLSALLERRVPPLRELRDDVPDALDDILLRALSRDPSARQASAQAVARALEYDVGVASQTQLVDWVRELTGAKLEARAQILRALRGAGQSEPAPMPSLERQTLVLPEFTAAQMTLELGTTKVQSSAPARLPRAQGSGGKRSGGKLLEIGAGAVSLLLLVLGAVGANQALRLRAAPGPERPSEPAESASDRATRLVGAQHLQPLAADAAELRPRSAPLEATPNAWRARPHRVRSRKAVAVPLGEAQSVIDKPQAFVPTGPPECYERVVKNGVEARVPKAACLGSSSK